MRFTQAEITANISSSVLYLRSFADEVVTSLALGGDNPFWPFRVETDEERLVRLLHIAGEVVAVGEPGEDLPELGAKRVYLADHEWQSVVTSWIESARLVVIRIGASDGVWWETKTGIARTNPKRLMLLVPDVQPTYSSFRQHFESEFAGFSSLPEIDQLANEASGLNLAGFIHFNENGVGHFDRVPRSTRGMRKAFAPFLAKLPASAR
jgi:hypothetical protein